LAKAPTKLPQAMRPSGRTGRVFGWLMAWLNAKSYRWVVDQLGTLKPRSILEIGFGTGDLLKLAIRKLKPARVSGVDPSELMVETAKKKLRRYTKKMEIDLRLGDDTALPQATFDAIIAAHSFQFWADPQATLARLHTMLSPEGRLVLVLRRHYSKKVAKWIPNPLSHSPNEFSATIAAAEHAGFVLKATTAISKSSQGLVFACG
jgi:cyclopropane fatty-acyl-phospholipid synthase-like methyltransferase